MTCPDGSTAIVSAPQPNAPTYLCHVPPGNPAKAHNIYVPSPAVAAHLEHGDYEGECE